MRCSFAVLAVFGAASVSASSIFGRQSLPDCASTCLANADLGGCQQTDTHCLCTNNAFVSSTTSCIEKTCTGSDLTAAEAAAQGLCAAVGVTLTAPASSATATTPATSTDASAATTAATSAATSGASGAATSKASSAVSAASSAASSAAGAASSAISSAASAATSAASKPNGARSNSVNAIAGVAALGLVAFAL